MLWEILSALLWNVPGPSMETLETGARLGIKKEQKHFHRARASPASLGSLGRIPNSTPGTCSHITRFRFLRVKRCFPTA